MVTLQAYRQAEKRVARSFFREYFEIEGVGKGGGRFRMEFPLTYDREQKSAEQAIIEGFGSQASCFEQLAVEQGWHNATWNYVNGRREQRVW